MASERRIGWVLCTALLVGCAHGEVRPFPLEEPLWQDPDRQPFSPKPEEYFSPFAWDAADQTVFRPISRLFAVDPGGEAINVNAMDEVPDSSWFENRIGMEDMPLERFLEAACEGEEPLDPTAGPWTVTDAKPNGANPGFIMEDAQGRKYLLKFDSDKQPERASSADVIGSILYWAAGYHAPCNRIVYFDRAILRIGEDATAEDEQGDEAPLNEGHIDTALDGAPQLADGRYRGMASQFLPGAPLGPWRYQGTREDDPNDVVPHQDRRDLRGAQVLASLINHFDSREQNTLAMWITDEDNEEKGHVRHNYVDFGDSLGSLWRWDAISRRLGRAYYLDIPYMMEDLVTLGLMRRPWDEVEYGEAGQTLGYYDVETFEADEWRPGYPTPAFGRMTERDAAWMARIIAQIPESYIVAAVREAQLTQPIVARQLVRVLLGRREKILRRWLRKLSPLTHPRVVRRGGGAELCLRDLAITAELWPWSRRPYRARAWTLARGGDRVRPVETGRMVRRPPDQICVGLPRLEAASPETPRYLIVDVTGLYGPEDDQSTPARVHLYQTGTGAHVVVGLERPYEADPPG